MGRIVGDGSCTFEVVDVAVPAELQGQGLGSRMMSELLLYQRGCARAGAVEALISDGKGFNGKSTFRPVAPDSRGM